MDAADLLEGGTVTIVDIDKGARLVTYCGSPASVAAVLIGINGAAAPYRAPGDLVDPVRLAQMEERRGAHRIVPAEDLLVDAREPGDRSGQPPDPVSSVPAFFSFRCEGVVSPR